MKQMTSRQQEIALLVAKKMSNREIAAETGLSKRTVEVHIEQAAKRVGGTGKPRERLIVWFYATKAQPTS